MVRFLLRSPVHLRRPRPGHQHQSDTIRICFLSLFRASVRASQDNDSVWRISQKFFPQTKQVQSSFSYGDHHVATEEAGSMISRSAPDTSKSDIVVLGAAVRKHLFVFHSDMFIGTVIKEELPHTDVNSQRFRQTRKWAKSSFCSFKHDFLYDKYYVRFSVSSASSPI